MGGIDWNISVDDTQIDWDIGAVDQLEESGNSFGSYEIIDYNVDLKDSENGKDLLYDNTSSKTAVGVVPEASESEICWDISLENHQVDMLEDAVVPDARIDKPNPTETSQPESFEERSQLLETDGKAPYHPVRSDLAADWYADRPLPGGTAKIDRRRSISIKIEEEEEKKYLAPSSLACRSRTLAAHGSPASRRRPRLPRATFVYVRGDNVSPR
ncbi:hypothetical protein BHM03_00047375 [Ensete ventricosum]|nr:hypothetical protein BHM03_00047375 [Ensete ventricosum]